MGVALSLQATAQAQPLPYQNPSLPVEQRVDDLLSRLTLQEKVQLMMNGSPAIERLGIPQTDWWSEALHGVGRNGLSTVFPSCIGMACSFDEELIERIYTAVSDEARAKNTAQRKEGKPVRRYQGLSFWTPNINIFRDPRWGRGQETYGEDPFMNAQMGLRVVRGLQGFGTKEAPLGAVGGLTSSSTLVPSTMPSIADQRRLVISSISKTCPNATFGRPICPPSATWCRKAALRR